MAADTTTLTEKMRAALRISSTSEKITEEINDCIAACKMDLQDVGVKKLEETDALIIRAIGGYDKLSEVFNKDNPNLFKDTSFRGWAVCCLPSIFLQFS